MFLLACISLIGIWQFKQDPVLSNLFKAAALIFMLLIPAQWAQAGKPKTWP